MKRQIAALALSALSLSACAQAPAAYDPELAKSLGGNANGMRRYVFVVLRSGPTPVPAGQQRDEMFAGHFANMQRLAKEGKLAYAGPLDGVDGARGIFILAVESIDEAKKLVATDPVVIKGEMVAEYHAHFGSAGLMMVNQVHNKIIQPAPPYTFIEGKVPEDVQPDGNSIVFEGPKEMLVIDTGRHPEHTDKIIAVAKARNKPITAIVNTHWHLDHATGNARIRAAYPGAKLYASTAVEGALKGFLIRNVDKARARLDDPAVPEARKADTRLYLNAINDPANLIPDQPVNGPLSIRLGERELQLHLARHAATEGDVWVHDPASKTVFVGDLVVVPLPFFDTGCAEGWRAALAQIDKVDFQTLVPGHGLPMDHATFTSYRSAFDDFTACAESSQPTSACVATWMQKGAKFVAAHPDRKYSEEALAYYVDQVLRVPARRKEYCGRG